MSKPKACHVAIIGGGLGGVALGVSLTKGLHITFTIYEAREPFGEMGTGIGFSSSGHKAMTLIDPRILEGYKKIACFNGSASEQGVRWEYFFGEKAKLEGKSIAQLILPKGKEQSTCRRKHFLEILLGPSPQGCTRLGKRLFEIDGGGDMIVCRFTDGSIAEADLVVGCDGIKSACRPFVFGANSELSRARFTGQVAYRGLIPIEKAVDTTRKERATKRIKYIGRNRHLVSFDMPCKKLVNKVAFHTTGSKTWGGPVVQLRTTAEFQKDFAGCGEEVRGMIVVSAADGNKFDRAHVAQAIQNPLVRAAFDHPPVSNFHNGRLCLLGDAAHSQPPHLGMGAGMTIEDANILGALLAESSSTDDIPAVLKAYDGVRVERARKIMATSRQQGEVVEFMAPGIEDDLDEIANHLDLEGRGWIWDIDLEGDLKEALVIFDKEKRNIIGLRNWVRVASGSCVVSSDNNVKGTKVTSQSESLRLGTVDQNCGQ